MSETAIFASVISALFGLTVALVAVVWALLQGRIGSLESKVAALEGQNTMQETAIGRLTERTLAREETHAQHREDTQAQFGRIDMRLGEMNAKLDKLLIGSRAGTPYPTHYGAGDKRSGGG